MCLKINKSPKIIETNECIAAVEWRKKKSKNLELEILLTTLLHLPSEFNVRENTDSKNFHAEIRFYPLINCQRCLQFWINRSIQIAMNESRPTIWFHNAYWINNISFHVVLGGFYFSVSSRTTVIHGIESKLSSKNNFITFYDNVLITLKSMLKTLLPIR